MRDTPILYGQTEPDQRPRVYFIVVTYGSSENNKAECFHASLDLDYVVEKAKKEAEELGFWQSHLNDVVSDPLMPSKDFGWAGDEGERMWIESLPLEGNILQQMAAL